jgi:hypothetical protein
MPDSDPSAHALDVPGARLYYERRGTGPLLLTTVVDFPGGHAGFVMYPEECGRVLHRVLSETPS